jgi:beta-N-acetylhexosaminidase
VLKHFPGHGRSSADSHNRSSDVPGLDSLRNVDLAPYRTLLDDGRVGVLVAHVRIPGYSDGPSSLSRKVVTDLLRKEYGHDGLVISDGLGMAGTGTYQGSGLVRFLQAGGDLGIVTAGGAPYARDAVRRAVADGKLPEKQLNKVAERVLRYKDVDACGLVGQ